MENLRNPKSNTLYMIGLLAIAIEFIIYLAIRKILLPEVIKVEQMPLIFLNHGITIVYFITIFIQSIVKNKWRFLRMDKRLFINFITLAYISAHSLNEEIVIFSRYPVWLNVLIISIFISLHLLEYIDRLPDFIRAVLFFIMGSGSITILYFTIYLAPFAPIGIIGLVFFGLTIYLFTPLILLIIIIYQFFRNRMHKTDNWAFISGLILPVLFSIIFLIRWQSTANEIEMAYQKIDKNRYELPDWLILGQQLPVNELSLKILSSNLCYDNLEYFGRWSNLSVNTISENVTHDPLVIIAQLLFGKFPLDDEICLKTIEYQYDARHETYRKLWSGRDLETRKIISNIDIYPEYRLAYIEKIFTISNNSGSEWSQQEALYTFKLPEGSVASSLSLWIDGKEQKSRLTTREKADSAYTAIVGYERRDPALLQWQEGNTITVTIFPCTRAEDRIFKIGITCPLELIDNQLILNDITFKGPNFSLTNETCNLQFISNHKMDADIPSGFKSAGVNKYISNGMYSENKTIKMKAPKLSNEGFSFQNFNYSLSEIKTTKVPFNPSKIYLDINRSWTYEEFEQIMKAYSGKQIYVFDNQLVLLNDANKNELFNKLNSLNFSVFPIFKIVKSNESLLISKSTKNSPYLKDFEETAFGKELEEYLQNAASKIKIANLGTQLSPYLKTLKEFTIFEYWQGPVDELIKLEKQKVFPLIIQAENEIVLTTSNCMIRKNAGESKTTAPDHLLRLFAYNQIMHMTGKNYFNNNGNFQKELIPIANEAYIVSPISSLVVLETMNDYERFGIEKNENSLENAAKNSSGSVPEPHEWVLIILSIIVVGFLYHKRKLTIGKNETHI